MNKAAAKPLALPKLTKEQSDCAKESLDKFNEVVKDLHSKDLHLSNFIEKALFNSNLTEQELKDLFNSEIDNWHEDTLTKLQLHEYLGMDWYDYVEIFNKTLTFKEILENYKGNPSHSKKITATTSTGIFASKSTKNIFKITLNSIKGQDEFGELISQLSLSEETIKRYFEFGEYASLELEVDENLNIIGGKFLPIKK